MAGITLGDFWDKSAERKGSGLYAEDKAPKPASNPDPNPKPNPKPSPNPNPNPNPNPDPNPEQAPKPAVATLEKLFGEEWRTEYTHSLDLFRVHPYPYPYTKPNPNPDH